MRHATRQYVATCRMPHCRMQHATCCLLLNLLNHTWHMQQCCMAHVAKMLPRCNRALSLSPRHGAAGRRRAMLSQQSAEFRFIFELSKNSYIFIYIPGRGISKISCTEIRKNAQLRPLQKVPRAPE